MATQRTKQYEKFYPKDRETWRAWLHENHASSKGVWLIYYRKHTGVATVSYDEAVEEALCYGWIDSIPNKIDDQKYMQLFSPRKKKSPWSKLNKERIEKLMHSGAMMPPGLEKIEQSRKDGSWTVLDNIEALIYPGFFKAALEANPQAEKNFRNFNKTYVKGVLWWLESAKRDETRQKRLKQVIDSAEKNEKLF